MHDLKSFTPVGLNRDDALLAIGRTSARPNSVWKWLCAGLLASQLMTGAVVWCCWPRSTDAVVSEVLPIEAPTPPETRPDPSSVIVLSQGFDSLPAHSGAMLSYPPLRAGSSGIE